MNNEIPEQHDVSLSLLCVNIYRWEQSVGYVARLQEMSLLGLMEKKKGTELDPDQ
jgi:hypothetical protein